jgi:coenzyme F420-0:L-glutamate ligase/coenzyme F420-1:gamma-L-glutamate ligase
MQQLIVTPIIGIPLINEGDDLAEIILKKSKDQNISIDNGDIFIIAQKIVSKSEGRMINLDNVNASTEAKNLAEQTEKDPRFVQLVLDESSCILRQSPGALIVEHKLGFVCANAGIDHSNVKEASEKKEEWYLLLPKDPDSSAKKIRCSIEKSTGKKIGVMIIDSHGRTWRLGVTGACIGISGIPALVDMRGHEDLFGYRLRITQIATADQLACAASLMMGESDEGKPVAHIRGFPYQLREATLKELIRSKEKDLFR